MRDHHGDHPGRGLESRCRVGSDCSRGNGARVAENIAGWHARRVEDGVATTSSSVDPSRPDGMSAALHISNIDATDLPGTAIASYP